MRVALGVVVLLGACNQVFGLDEPAVGLLALTPSRGELEPPFDRNVHAYTVALSPLTFAATVSAVATGDATVTIEPPDPVALVPGEPRTVTVEASADGETSMYTVAFARGARPPDIEMLTAPTPRPGAAFGNGIAIEGDRLVVGAASEDIGGSAEECDGNPMTPPLPPRGAVYIFERTAAGYQLEQRIQVPAGARCAAFGESLALSGDLLVVGSFRELRPLTYFLAGTAYVYRRAAPGDWVLVTQLVPPTSYLNQLFGYDVATDGRRIVVSAHGEANGGVGNAGALYVFSSDDGFLTPRRVVRAGSANDYFGFAIELDGDGILSTAFGDDQGATDSGAIIPIDAALVPGGQIKLVQPVAGEYLGQSLKVNGDALIVATPSATNQLGTSYVFRRDRDPLWTEAVRLSRDTGAANDRIGLRVAATGDLFVVGACLGAANIGGWTATDAVGSIPEAGFALVYRDGGRDDVRLLGVMAAPVPVAGGRFSCDLATDGDRIVAGAPVETVDESAPGAGVVYIYR